MTTPAPGGDPGRAVERSDTSKSTALAPENPAPPVFIVRLELLPAISGHAALRKLTKRARRNNGLRCVAFQEEHQSSTGAQSAPEDLLERRAAWLAEAERRAAR